MAQTENSYVGSKKCLKCHSDYYYGWKSTLHPYKFQDATPEAVVGDFTKNNTLNVDGHTVRMEKQDDKYYFIVPGNDGKDSVYQVKYLIGGFWKQLYVTEFPNGELHILPAMWIVEKQVWAKCKYWSKTVYQLSCTGCHNTGSQINYNEKTRTYDTKWADKGVACEACHGPGQRHVEAAQHKGDVYSTIVNPARIPDARRAAMVCGACHNRGTTPDGKYGYPYGYKPGDKLNFMFSEKPKLHPDETSKANRQQYIDWKKSGHAREGVMCWDCHFTHRRGKANKAQTKLPGNALCRSCHVVADRGVHGIHSVNNCIGCHMPSLGKRGVKGDVHSHEFRVISPADTIKAGSVEKQPNSCNQCHYHKKDKPDTLLKVLEKVKQEGKKRDSFYK
jgi:predicted CXXCH cytochrome family protein